MTRYENWPELLHAFVDSRLRAVFLWGEADCSLFVADAVQVMTGVDIAESVRGKYRTPAGAARLVRKLGGMAAIADARLDRIPTLSAGRGDVVLVETPRGDAFGICLGRQIVAQGPDGLEFLDLSCAMAAWRERACLQ